MKKLLLYLMVLCIACWTGYGYEFFINSEPIHASVYSGETFLGKTPLRLVGEESRTLLFTIRKDGYEAVREEVALTETGERMRFFSLSPERVSIVLDQKGSNVLLNEVSAGESPLVISGLPDGTYKIEKSRNAISISNAEYSHSMRTTVTETIFSGLLFSGSVAGMAHLRGIGDTMNAHAFGFASVVFGTILTYNLFKLSKISIEEKKDRIQMSGVSVREFTGTDDRDTFTEGMSHIGKEKWEEAVRQFLLVINLHEDSHFVPVSYYEAGYAYLQAGNYPKALQYLKDFVYSYPIYELFPYGVLHLFDVQLRLGRPADALSDYESLRPLYIDDTSGMLHADYYDRMVTMFEKTGGTRRDILDDLLSELDRYLDTYRSSPNYSKILLLKGTLLYRWLDKKEGAFVFEEIKERYPHDTETMREVERILHE
ncbi:MAG: PEGA domain-containing protein [Spirochaetes bacterium]|nr:PEGA domain-containing protein [Spirochaetota bacterium]